MKLILFLHGLLVFAKAQVGADEPADGRGLRGATGATGATAKCLRAGKACGGTPLAAPKGATRACAPPRQ
jgi:hypothetical protein